jgi:hypothetical protein
MALLDLLSIGGKILDKVIPDPAERNRAKLALLELNQRGQLANLDADVKLALGQMEVNKVEASSGSMFRGGWRPAVGWTCVLGLLYTYLLRPVLPWIVAVFGGEVPPLPPIDTMELIVLLGGMLGLSGMRTAERLQGKA